MKYECLKGSLPAILVVLAIGLGCSGQGESPRNSRGKGATPEGSKAASPRPSGSPQVERVPTPFPSADPPTEVNGASTSTPKPGAEVIVGRVVGVSDGDTITVLDVDRSSFKIRLATIDSPEKNQDFGARAKESLSELVFNKQVEVEVRTTDRYGRVVGVVRIGGTDVNLEQIRRGLAWHYTQYSREQPFEEKRIYAAAEREARSRKVGLWVRDDAVEPWSFRRGRRRGGDSAE